MAITRRDFARSLAVTGVGSTLLPSLSVAQGPNTASKRLNILFIISDQRSGQMLMGGPGSGRFVSGFGGEQFALPEVPDSLRATENWVFKADVTIAGADPVNLIGILIPGERVPAVPGRSFIITNELLAGSGPVVSRHTERSRLRNVSPTSSSLSDLEGPSLSKIPVFGRGI